MANVRSHRSSFLIVYREGEGFDQRLAAFKKEAQEQGLEYMCNIKTPAVN
jgi:hypothetical protein